MTSTSNNSAATAEPVALRQLLARWWLPLLFFTGIVIYFPCLRSPFLLDDYLHASMIDGTFPAPRGPFDLYDFVNDADRPVLTERGMLPWWSHPDLTVRFFRPLPSALRWADHKLLGARPLPLHAISLAWWIAAVLAARALFTKTFSPRVSMIATIVFAIAPCHVLPLAWLANREALVSLTFGILALGAHLRWRDHRRPRDAAIALALFSLAMLGGEYALCIGGYVLAREIVDRREPIARRALGLLTFTVPAAAYLGARILLGYGTAGSGFYSDPVHDPLAYLRTAPRRMATLLADAWLSLDTETLSTKTPWWALVLIMVLGVALFRVPIARALARLDEARRRTASWLFLGSFIALVPVLAVMPSPRLLGACMLGVAPIVALVLDRAWFPEVREERRGPAELAGLVALVLGFSHLVHAPMTSWLVGRKFQKSAVYFASAAASLQRRLAGPGADEVIVVRGIGGVFFLPFAVERLGAPPDRWRILSQTGHALALRRDARTIDIIVPKDNSVFPSGPGNLFRPEDARLAVGDTFTVSGMRATVMELGDDGPRSVRFEFDRPLESSSLVWIAERYDGFHEESLPDPGFGKPFDP